MNSAVALVRAYLNFNGYFTVTEYPVVEAIGPDNYRTATDVDVLAIRLPGAGRIVPCQGRDSSHDLEILEPDPELAPANDRIDMIIAEVKEGAAELNRGARDRGVLRAALRRFGAIPQKETDAVVDSLLDDGEAQTSKGYRVRLMAFGSYRGRKTRRNYKVIKLGHVLEVMVETAAKHWSALQHAQFTDPAISMLVMLEKAKLGLRSDEEI